MTGQAYLLCVGVVVSRSVHGRCTYRHWLLLLFFNILLTQREVSRCSW